MLSENAETVRATIAAEGASFIGDIQAITGLTMLALREAIRELVAWGLVTNDTVEALREVARWKPMMPRTGPDPTSWLPADYTPSPNRRIVQRVPIFEASPEMEAAGQAWRCAKWLDRSLVAGAPTRNAGSRSS